jgi:hypothetical protein
MAKAMIHSYDSRTFKINYFHGASPESPGLILLYSRSDKKNLILQRNLVLKTFNIFRDQGFHILMIDLSEIAPTVNANNQTNGASNNLSSNHNVASMIQDCYTCIEYFIKLFAKMNELWLCSFSYESILALQITMRMLTLEKFILICPKIFGFDTQNISSCTAEGLIIHVNSKKKKETQILNDVVGILRNQKKVFVDCVKIDTNEEYLHNKYHLLEEILVTYIAKNYSNKVEQSQEQTLPGEQEELDATTALESSHTPEDTAHKTITTIPQSIITKELKVPKTSKKHREK